MAFKLPFICLFGGERGGYSRFKEENGDETKEPFCHFALLLGRFVIHSC